METLTNDLKSKANEVSVVLKSIANPERLMILCILSQDRLTVGQLEDNLNLSQSALSQHLAKLRNAEIVSTEREGKFIYYQISDTKILKIFETLHDLYCSDQKECNL